MSRSSLASVMHGLTVLLGLGLLMCLTGCGGESGAEPLKAGFDGEFLTRPDGYPGLKEHYGFEFSSPPLQLEPGLMYRACADGSVDVIDAFATDGRIPAYDLKVLEDDRRFFPPYYAAPLVRADVLNRHPQLEDILGKLSGRLSNQTMRQLNFQADEHGRKAREVAREFLESEGLLEARSTSGEGSGDKARVGSKHFTEQEILGELMSLLIEHHSDLRVARKLNLGGTMICFNALKAGDLDLYAEYTGTGLVNILQTEVISDPEQVLRVVKEAFREQWDLVWLEPFGFNNAYTLAMRKEQADRLGIETISDLAGYVRSRQAE